MVKILSQIIFFQTFLAKLFFSLKIQHQIIYLGKNHAPPPPSFKNGIIRLEAGAFKFLRNRLFMTSMQLLRKRDVPSSAISKMSRSLPRRRKNNMQYSAK